MKKTILYSFIAASAALSLAACSSDDLAGTQNDGKALVAFTVQSPNGIDTRAYADGTTANKLKYAVYDSNNAFLFDGSQDIPMKTTVTLNLATDNTYKVVFWAESASSPYTIDWNAKTMTYNPADAKAQDENRDAFYKEVELTVTGNSQQTVELRRPFAQLNIGTDDVAAAHTAGLDVTETQVTVSGVPTTLNLLDGSENVTYTYAAIPTSETFPVTHTDASKSYSYLSMNYILMSEDKQTTDVTGKFKKGTTEHERTYASVPVQRNYRTNIYGSLLTNTASFNVEIKPEFEKPDYNPVIVNSMADLITAIANGSDYVTLAANTTYELNAENKAAWENALKNKTVTIAGTDKASTILKPVYGSGEYLFSAEGANVTFENLTIQTPANDNFKGIRFAEDTYKNCIINGFFLAYTPKSTFEGCTFNQTTKAYYPLWQYGTKDLTVKNCTFNSGEGGKNRAILVYTAGSTGNSGKKIAELNITVENCTFNSGEGGKNRAILVYTAGSTGNSGKKIAELNITVENCTFNSGEGGKNRAILVYTAGSTGNSGKKIAELNITVENCTFKGTSTTDDKSAIEIHTECGTWGTLTLKGTNTATGFYEREGNPGKGLWIEKDNVSSGEPLSTAFTIVENGVTIQTSTAK